MARKGRFDAAPMPPAQAIAEPVRIDEGRRARGRVLTRLPLSRQGEEPPGNPNQTAFLISQRPDRRSGRRDRRSCTFPGRRRSDRMRHPLRNERRPCPSRRRPRIIVRSSVHPYSPTSATLGTARRSGRRRQSVARSMRLRRSAADGNSFRWPALGYASLRRAHSPTLRPSRTTMVPREDG